MLWKLMLVLTVVPLLELYLLVRLSEWTSFWFTVLVILGTGAVGAVIARMQGLMVLRRMQWELSEGRVPTGSILDGVMILVAAALLVTPGLLTDTVGFVLLAPPGRAFLRKLLRRWLKRQIDRGRVRFFTHMGFGPFSDEPPPAYPPLDDEDGDPWWP